MKFQVQYWDNVHHELKIVKDLTLTQAQEQAYNVLKLDVADTVTIARTH